jgi:hypothetical protein
MKQQITRWAEALHFPLWIAKDAAWFFGLGWLSLGLAVPVILLGILVTWESKGLQRWEWTLLTLWLLANTVWMASELIGIPHSAATLSWSFALGVLPLYLVYLRKNLKMKK